MVNRPAISWNAYPLIRMLLPFAVGIALSFYYAIPTAILLPMTLACCCLLVLSHISSRRWIKMRYVAAVMSGISLLVMGALLMQLHLPGTIFPSKKPTTLLTTIVTAPEQRISGYRTTAVINSMLEDPTLQGEKILIYLPDDSSSGTLLPGDRIWIKGSLTPISPPVNPGMFDFKRYMSLKGISGSIRIRQGCFLKTGEISGLYFLSRYAEIASRFLGNILDKYMPKEMDQAVLAGILLGKRADLGDNIIQQFQDTGIMHILSVSGMHVAILYGLLLVLFRWIPAHHRRIHLAKEVIILIIIWTFAYITGLSPAVRRAAFIFSLILVGRTFRRQVSGFNLLAGSALILLILEPGLLFNAGFQLSYAAVAGIMIWYKPIYSLLTPKGKISELFWQTIAVSLSAQVATLPLTWYYFGTFPLYFLLGNLAAVPLSGVIMWLGILLIIISPISYIGHMIAYLLHQTISFLLWSIALISRLPHASLSEGYLPPVGVFLLYFMLVSVSMLVLMRRKEWITGIFAALITLTILLQIHSWKIANSREAWIWHIPGHSTLVTRTGRQVSLWADSTLLKDEKTMSYQLSGYMLKNNIRKIDTSLLDTMERPYISSNGNLVGIIRKRKNQEKEIIPAHPQYIWIQNEPYLDTNQLHTISVENAFIVDGSNRYARTKLYKRLVGEAKLLETGKGAIPLNYP